MLGNFGCDFILFFLCGTVLEEFLIERIPDLHPLLRPEALWVTSEASLGAAQISMVLAESLDKKPLRQKVSRYWHCRQCPTAVCVETYMMARVWDPTWSPTLWLSVPANPLQQG